jgi:predicted acylesterase/phospholipase RssA
LISGREVVHRTGDAVRAILESINLPVISKPIIHDGMALVDGSVLTESYLAVRRSEWAAYSAGDAAFEQQGHFAKY